MRSMILDLIGIEPTWQEFVLKARSLVLLGDATFDEALLLVAEA